MSAAVDEAAAALAYATLNDPTQPPPPFAPERHAAYLKRVAADAGAATYGMQRPSDDPEDDRIRAELAEAKRKAALRLPRAPLAERDALLRKRVPPDVDLLVRARNKILEGAPVLLRYAV